MSVFAKCVSVSVISLMLFSVQSATCADLDSISASNFLDAKVISVLNAGYESYRKGSEDDAKTRVNDAFSQMKARHVGDEQKRQGEWIYKYAEVYYLAKKLRRECQWSELEFLYETLGRKIWVPDYLNSELVEVLIEQKKYAEALSIFQQCMPYYLTTGTNDSGCGNAIMQMQKMRSLVDICKRNEPGLTEKQLKDVFIERQSRWKRVEVM